MKYLVVFKTYSGKYYRGEFTTIYDTYEEMIQSLEENKNSLGLKFYKAYTINEELNLNEFKEC